jgi:large subunit ribosomal protein L27
MKTSHWYFVQHRRMLLGFRSRVLFGNTLNASLSAFAPRRFASKAAGATSKNGRDSHSKKRGVKKAHGQAVKVGNIIYTQCGTKWHPGEGVGLARNGTLYALKDGKVELSKKAPSFRSKSKRYRVVANVIPKDAPPLMTVLEW